jgi:hypothetical protein
MNVREINSIVLVHEEGLSVGDILLIVVEGNEHEIIVAAVCRVLAEDQLMGHRSRWCARGEVISARIPIKQRLCDGSPTKNVRRELGSLIENEPVVQANSTQAKCNSDAGSISDSHFQGAESIVFLCRLNFLIQRD